MKRLVPAMVVALVLGACSDSGTATPTLPTGTTAPPATSATTTSSPPPTTVETTPPPQSTSSSTTSVLNVSIPFPQTEGESDFEVIWRELIEYHNWVHQNPELADVALYISEDCECFATVAARIAEYAANGWRETSEGLIIHDVDVDLSTSTFALMTVIDEHTTLVLVDADGTVIEEEDRRPKTFYDVGVTLEEDGWRITEWFRRGAVGDAE